MFHAVAVQQKSLWTLFINLCLCEVIFPFFTNSSFPFYCFLEVPAKQCHQYDMCTVHLALLLEQH